MHGSSASLDFYNNVIAPYKGSLEEWFVSNRGIYIYFLAIFITVFKVIFPRSQIAWELFKNIPKPPKKLLKQLNYKE